MSVFTKYLTIQLLLRPGVMFEEWLNYMSNDVESLQETVNQEHTLLNAKFENSIPNCKLNLQKWHFTNVELHFFYGKSNFHQVIYIMVV